MTLALGALVIGAGTAVTVQSLVIRRTVKAQFNERWRRVHLLDRFEQDVRSLVTWIPDAGQVVLLPDNDNELVRLILLDDVDDPATSMRRRLPARVSYRLALDPENTQRQRLIRHSEPLVEGYAPHEEILAEPIVEARVDAYPRDPWSAGPEEKTPQDLLPLALRITCIWSDEDSAPAVRTTLVQADHEITSKKERK